MAEMLMRRAKLHGELVPEVVALVPTEMAFSPFTAGELAGRKSKAALHTQPFSPGVCANPTVLHKFPQLHSIILSILFLPRAYSYSP